MTIENTNATVDPIYESNPTPMVTSQFALNKINNTLIYSEEFQDKLGKMKHAVNQGAYLMSQPIDTESDDEIVELEENMKPVMAEKTNIDNYRKDLVTYLNKSKDAVLNFFDKTLDDAGYNDLETLKRELKSLKDTKLANRKLKRWAELEDTFNENLINYPNIQNYAPELTSFDLFKLRHPKIVTGSKTANIGTKQRKMVTDDLHEMNEVLELLVQNTNNLEPQFLNVLKTEVIKNPTKAAYFEALANVTELQRVELERRAEQKRLAEEAELARQREEQLAKERAENEARQREALQQQNIAQLEQLKQQQDLIDQQARQVQAEQEAKRQAQMAQVQNQQSAQTIVLNWLSTYTIQNAIKYSNVAQDQKQRVALMYELMHSLDDLNSEFSKFVNSYGNKEAVIFETMKAITNL